MTSAERENVYRAMFRLNHAFHGIVLRLDELEGLLGRQNLRDMKGLAQELQTEINTLALEKLGSIEERDWEQFGRIRAAMERRLHQRKRHE
jgi:hypothetical protein